MDETQPIRLRVIPQPVTPRTIFNQKDATEPVFRGENDLMCPDWQCGRCANLLVTNVVMVVKPGMTRCLPAPLGGEVSVLSVSIPSEGGITQSEGGVMVVKCAACGSF